MSYSDRHSLDIGTTPYGEDCAQVGQDSYMRRSRIEIEALVDMLERTMPEHVMRSGIGFKITSNPHDFGSYRGLEVYWYDEDEGAAEAAYYIEANIPEFWDDDAREYLKKHGYYEEVQDATL